MGSMLPVIFLVVLLSKTCHGARKVSAEGLAAFKACKSQEGVSDEELQKIQQGCLPTTTTAKCFVACMMEKSNLMKNGKYNNGQANKMAEGTIRNNRQKLQRAKNKISSCMNQTQQITDRCELAASMAQCMKGSASSSSCSTTNL